MHCRWNDLNRLGFPVHLQDQPVFYQICHQVQDNENSRQIAVLQHEDEQIHMWMEHQ